MSQINTEGRLLFTCEAPRGSKEVARLINLVANHFGLKAEYEVKNKNVQSIFSIRMYGNYGNLKLALSKFQDGLKLLARR